MAKTASPGAKCSTSGPTASTSPATSKPRTTGSFAGSTKRRLPRRIFQSIGLTPAARPRTSTCPGPGAAVRAEGEGEDGAFVRVRHVELAAEDLQAVGAGEGGAGRDLQVQVVRPDRRRAAGGRQRPDEAQGGVGDVELPAAQGDAV